MIGFQHISKVYIPISCLENIYDHLREAGLKGLEGVALLIGKSNGDIFEVSKEIIPAQNAFNHDGGLLYTVEGEELHRINMWLYKNKMQLIAQIHSHPSVAYHSETDDKYPIVTTIGGISIVIPDFGFNSISTTNWAVYRLSNNGWIEQNESEVSKLLIII